MKIGIAGFGLIGQLHARLLEELVGTENIVVAGKEVSKDMAFDTREDYKDLVDCDAVIVSLPTELHKEAVEYFAELKKPMLIEKPAGVTLEESEHIIDTVRKHNISAMIALAGLYHPDFRTMYDALKSGVIGKVTKVSEVLHEANTSLDMYLNVHRGVMNINGIHTLHRFTKIAEIIEASGDYDFGPITLSKKEFPNAVGEDRTIGSYTKNGVPFHFDIGFFNRDKMTEESHYKHATIIEGEKGSITTIAWEKCVLSTEDGEKVLYDKGPLGMESQYERIALGVREELKDFLQVVENHVKDHHTLQEILTAKDLVEQCYKNATLDS